MSVKPSTAHPPALIEQQQQTNHIRFVVGNLTFLALVSIGCGTYLLASGYQSGELYVGVATAVTGYIGGVITGRAMAAPHPPTTPSGAIATEVTNPATNPVNVATPPEP